MLDGYNRYAEIPYITERTRPPSTRIVVPVMYVERSEARKVTRLASSTGSPTRPTAVSEAR